MNDHLYFSGSVDRYMELYGPKCIGWQISRFLTLNDLQPERLTCRQQAEQKALTTLLYKTSPFDLLTYRKELVNKSNSRPNSRRAQNRVRKIQWITDVYSNPDKLNPSMLFPEDADSNGEIYDLGEMLFGYLRDYLLEKLRQEKPCFIEATVTSQLEYGIAGVAAESDMQHPDGTLKVREIISDVVTNIIDEHLPDADYDTFMDGFEGYVAALMAVQDKVI